MYHTYIVPQRWQIFKKRELLSSVVIRPVGRQIKPLRISGDEAAGVVHLAGAHAGFYDRAPGVDTVACSYEDVAVFVDFGTVSADSIASSAT